MFYSKNAYSILKMGHIKRHISALKKFGIKNLELENKWKINIAVSDMLSYYSDICIKPVINLAWRFSFDYKVKLLSRSICMNVLYKVQVTLCTNAIITIIFYVHFKKLGQDIIYVPTGVCDFRK